MSRVSFRLYDPEGGIFTREAVDNLPRETRFQGRPAWITRAIWHPAHPEYVEVTVTTVCPDCKGIGIIPRAEWWTRGGTRAPDYDRDPIVRVAVCPACYVPTHLTTVEMGKPGAGYALLDPPGARYEVHLAGEAANGGTGPNICGLDRHARGPDGKALRGFSVGGGVYGGPGYPASHEACPGCRARIDGRPVSGTHAGLF